MHPALVLADAAQLNAQQFGAYGFALAGCLIVIVWLARKLNASEERERALHERVADLGRELAPVLERSLRELERRDR